MPATRLNEKAIFNIARRIDCAEARNEYLRQVCGDDPAVADRVRVLLRGFEKQASFLEEPAAHIGVITSGAASAVAPGAQIGPYKLREQIGEGGMGVVYVAEQTEPVRRKVALKIIKPGLATKDVLARFEAERQALAMMDHPNIARVFDAGTTEAGQPYFAMELVQGPSITEYCDGRSDMLPACQLNSPEPANSPDEPARWQRAATIRERLDLFLSVCRAVQHAHQKGVIHRDLKPSNVLVPEIDGRPVPKVIDFGIAKATSAKLTDKTVYTQFTQLIGTPTYMSPEQAGLGVVDVDTRSDIYSLGVLLYELLTGTTPFDAETLRQAGIEETLRTIRETDPLPPSKRRSQIAVANGHNSALRIPNSALDLDWIVLKALEKDRTRRYETAADLARDIERYLADEPIHARPPSRVYRVKKFVRKHRVGVGAAAVTITSLATGIVVALFGWSNAIEQSRLTAAERDRAATNLRLATSLIDDVVTPTAEVLLSVEELNRRHANLVVDGVEFYRRMLRDVGNDSTIRRGLVNALRALGAQRLHTGKDVSEPTREAIAILETLVDDFPDVIQYRSDLANAYDALAIYYYYVDRCTEALHASETAVRLSEVALEHDPSNAYARQLAVQCKLMQARVCVNTGDHALAESLFRDGLETGTDAHHQQIAHQAFADLLMRTNRQDEAAAELAKSERILRAMPSDTTVAKSVRVFWLCAHKDWKAMLHLQSGDFSQALTGIEAAIDDMSRLDESLPQVSWTDTMLGWHHLNAANAHVHLGELDEAAASLNAAVHRWRGDQFGDRQNTAQAHWMLGEVLHTQGKPREAEARFRLAADVLNELASRHPEEARSHGRLIVFLTTCPNETYRDAARAVMLAERVIRETDGPMWLFLGLARYRAGEWAGAEEALRKGIELRNGGDALDWLLLAATQYRAGKREESQTSYAHARERIDRGAPVYVGYEISVLTYEQIRAEVEALFRRGAAPRDTSASTLPPSYKEGGKRSGGPPSYSSIR